MTSLKYVCNCPTTSFYTYTTETDYAMKVTHVKTCKYFKCGCPGHIKSSLRQHHILKHKQDCKITKRRIKLKRRRKRIINNKLQSKLE